MSMRSDNRHTKNKWHQPSRASEEGFTLFEMLVVIAIVGILSVVFLADIRGGESRQLLRRGVQTMAQDIRDVQQRALSARELESGSCNGVVVPGGYGILFETSNPGQYTLFADCNGNGRLGGNDFEFPPTSLPEGIVIDNLQVDTNNRNSIEIVFLPPDPEVAINGNGTEATIRLMIEGGSCPDDCDTVSVNIFGRVDIAL